MSEEVVLNPIVIPENEGDIIQEISSDPLFPLVQRYVKTKELRINWANKYISLSYEIIYLKDNIDISHKFSSNFTPITADNWKMITPRDENGEYIIEMESYTVPAPTTEDPDAFETLERVKKVPMYSYLLALMQLNISINSLLIGFILENDEDGFYDY